ncbi:hypothetical protein WN51_04859 [Melipona quadrifasciata]|uniref:Uncharacterized protein n=1 Tax=Melipona quadrifasciata TaxID=166423 RepID=A0A0M8ZV18_9HYME|nr:hypothetical protein WN51_04859 [Melipona quadrifasciata]
MFKSDQMRYLRLNLPHGIFSKGYRDRATSRTTCRDFRNQENHQSSSKEGRFNSKPPVKSKDFNRKETKAKSVDAMQRDTLLAPNGFTVTKTAQSHRVAQDENGSIGSRANRIQSAADFMPLSKLSRSGAMKRVKTSFGECLSNTSS